VAGYTAKKRCAKGTRRSKVSGACEQIASLVKKVAKDALAEVAELKKADAAVASAGVDRMAAARAAAALKRQKKSAAKTARIRGKIAAAEAREKKAVVAEKEVEKDRDDLLAKIARTRKAMGIRKNEENPDSLKRLIKEWEDEAMLKRFNARTGASGGGPPGVPPPNDGNFVLLVAPGVTGIIKKIWFLSFLFLYFCIFVFLYFCIFYLSFFIVLFACLISSMISVSACWCPVAVLGCAAMISWTLAARLVPIHPWHSGSSGISWRMYLRSWVHFFIQRVPFASPGLATLAPSPTPISSVAATLCSHRSAFAEQYSVVGGRTPPLKNTIAIIPKIPQ
jgi:hypothetical protein